MSFLINQANLAATVSSWLHPNDASTAWISLGIVILLALIGLRRILIIIIISTIVWTASLLLWAAQMLFVNLLLKQLLLWALQQLPDWLDWFPRLLN